MPSNWALRIVEVLRESVLAYSSKPGLLAAHQQLLDVASATAGQVRGNVHAGPGTNSLHGPLPMDASCAITIVSACGGC